jgi:hypothetical protein
MLGQHPQLYGLPEVNLFVAPTIRERQGLLARPRWSEHGLLRAVAELFGGTQTVETIALARTWIARRANRSCVSVFRELAERVQPQRLVDKSPRTVTKSEYLYRVLNAFPETRFIHLIRHPRSQGESLWEMGGELAAHWQDAIDYSTYPPTPDLQKAWFAMQTTIVTFLAGVPRHKWIRLRGEDLLARPDEHLREICQWLELPTDDRAIAAMKHPECSPFARPGPRNALLGNDPSFLRDPALRQFTAKNLTLDGPLPWRADGVGFSDEVCSLARKWGYR